jgi:hypothetical protein
VCAPSIWAAALERPVQVGPKQFGRFGRTTTKVHCANAGGSRHFELNLLPTTIVLFQLPTPAAGHSPTASYYPRTFNFGDHSPFPALCLLCAE